VLLAVVMVALKRQLVLFLIHQRLLLLIQAVGAVVLVMDKQELLVALASSSSDTLQHKALPHHLVAQTTPKLTTLMATRFTLGHHLEL
jgi:hypothetical protein